MRPLHQQPAQLPVVQARPPCVHEAVEGSLGRAAQKAGDPVEALHHQFPAGPVFGHHLPDAFLRPGEGGQRGVLARGGRAGHEVLLKERHAPDELRRADGVSDPPPRHRVRLGQAVDEHRACPGPRKCQGAYVRAVEDDAVVDLVRDDEEIPPLGQLHHSLHLAGRQHPAGGIGGAVEHNRPGPGGAEGLQFFRHQRRLVAHLEGEANGDTPHHGHLGGMVGPARVGQEHLIPRVDAGQKRQAQRAHTARRHDHLGAGIVADAPGALDGVSHRLPQPRDPAAGRVAGGAVPSRRQGRFHHVGRGREVGFAKTQVDGVGQLGSPVEHVPDRRAPQGRRTLCHEAPQGHRATFPLCTRRLALTMGGRPNVGAGTRRRPPRPLQRSGGNVDLRPLQPAAEVHVDALPLGVKIDGRLTGLPVAVAGLAHPAEGQVHL